MREPLLPSVYLVVRVTGEYSDRVVAIVGAYSEMDIDQAQALAEDLKSIDRAAHVVSNLWHKEFNKRRKEKGITDRVGPDNVDEAAQAVGMEPRPRNFGSKDSEYTVVKVPMNEAGEWIL